MSYISDMLNILVPELKDVECIFPKLNGLVPLVMNSTELSADPIVLLLDCLCLLNRAVQLSPTLCQGLS
jgi:hypothetical protein